MTFMLYILQIDTLTCERCQQLPQEERTESIMREAFLWGQVAGPILGGCLVWGRSGPSMVFSRAVLSACLASLLVPAAWRGPSHVALRLFQGLCTVSRQIFIVVRDSYIMVNSAVI